MAPRIKSKTCVSNAQSSGERPPGILCSTETRMSFGKVAYAIRASVPGSRMAILRRISGPLACQISDKSVISLLDSRDRDEGGRPPPLILLILVFRFDIAFVVIPERPFCTARDRAKTPRDHRTFDCDNCAQAGLRSVGDCRRGQAPAYTARP